MEKMDVGLLVKEWRDVYRYIAEIKEGGDRVLVRDSETGNMILSEWITPRELHIRFLRRNQNVKILGYDMIYPSYGSSGQFYIYYIKDVPQTR